MSEMPPPGNDTLEASLREALRPVQPSPGFADRVLARVAEREARSVSPRTRSAGQAVAQPTPKARFWEPLAAWARAFGFGGSFGFAGRGWAVALTGLLLAVVAVGWYQQESARKQAELRARQEAREKALLALRITSEKLGPARRALAELGIDLGPRPTAEDAEGKTAQ